MCGKIGNNMFIILYMYTCLLDWPKLYRCEFFFGSQPPIFFSKVKKKLCVIFQVNPINLKGASTGLCRSKSFDKVFKIVLCIELILTNLVTCVLFFYYKNCHFWGKLQKNYIIFK